MTAEEKLKHFMDVSIESANRKSSTMLEEYRKATEKIFEEHKEDAKKKAALQIKLGKDALERDKNKELSKEQIKIKKQLSKEQQERKEELFVEVLHMLEKYMTTRRYQEMLIKQIKEAKSFARGEEIVIYIDAADSAKLVSLETATNTPLQISKSSFIGGTRAIIESKNILIDNSFETKLKEAKEAFAFINK